MNKEKMKKTILSTKGGDFKKWYDSLTTSGKELYNQVINELKNDFYKNKNPHNPI